MKSINDKELRFEAIMRELRENFLDAFAMLEHCPVCKEEFDPSLMVDGVLICERHGRFVVTWTDGTPAISWNFFVQEAEIGSKEDPAPSKLVSEKKGLGAYFWNLFLLVTAGFERETVQWENVIIICVRRDIFIFQEMTEVGGVRQEWTIPDQYHEELRRELAKIPIRPA